jgi:SAM-dependent methyltransferase
LPDFGRYGPSTYGDRIAGVFDESFVPHDEHSAAGFLASVAGAGPALELGIGTGRVALPLRRLGVEVDGIEASDAMIDRLRQKRGGKRIQVWTGDLADVDVGTGVKYPLIYVVFNTFFALLTQDDQVRCFQNVAAHLTPGGAFVIEAFVPDPSKFDDGQRTETFELTNDLVRLDVMRHEADTQRILGQHVVITQSQVRLYPLAMRYAWPSELDLMARVAGLRLRERWGGWHHEPFTSVSVSHVSVYERARRR